MIIQEQILKLKEIGKGATERPWKCDQPYGQWDTPLIETAEGGQLARLTHHGKMRQDSKLIVTAANSYDTLLEVIEGLVRALVKFKQYGTGCDVALKALTDAEEKLEKIARLE